jgi:hypothetical protein
VANISPLQRLMITWLCLAAVTIYGGSSRTGGTPRGAHVEPCDGTSADGSPAQRVPVPPGNFGASAVAALKQWRYYPTATDRSEVEIRLKFGIDTS